MHRMFIVVLILTSILTACTFGADRDGMMRGMDEGMMQRHRAPIPEEYAGLTNPVPATTESLARGEALYTANCASCHGERGLGNGPAAEGLDPAPAPIAHTAQMVSDAYLFYRITEGGGDAPFNSAMPAFEDSLSERERWDVINYVRSLDGAMDGGMMEGIMQDGMMNSMMIAWCILGLFVLLIVVGAIVGLVVWLVRRTGSSATPTESPTDVLKQRLARGDSMFEQYRELKRQLEEG